MSEKTNIAIEILDKENFHSENINIDEKDLALKEKTLEQEIASLDSSFKQINQIASIAGVDLLKYESLNNDNSYSFLKLITK